MAGPPQRIYTDIPISTIAGIDNVGGIQGALAAHDLGMFGPSALLSDAMMRSDRISGVLKTRVGALLAAPLEVKPANGKAKAGRVARRLKGEGGDDPGLWDRMFPHAVVKGLSKWGNLMGLGLAQILWQTTETEWIPRLKLWHPQHVYWDTMDMQYVVIAREGTVRLPRIDETPMGDGTWVLWCPYGFQHGWLDALVRSLADLYMMRTWGYRDWARYNERHGMATIGAQTPQDADDAVKDKFAQDISNIGSDAVVELPEGFDLKMIEATARSFDSFDLFGKKIDVDIAVAVLGQNLTTEGGTDGGSRALGQVQNLVRIDKAIEDALLANCLREQVLTHWAYHNYGDPELAPRPAYQVLPPEDELKEAATLKAVGDGLGALKAAGAPIDVRTILDRAGVPMVTEEEQAAMEAVAAEERAARAAAFGGGGGGGAGGEEEEEEQAPGEKPAPGEEALSASGARTPAATPVKRYQFQGLPIAVENPAGSIRIWREPGPNGGTVGSTTMLHDYGFVEGHLSGDDEELDCYIGPNLEACDVHVVHQRLAPEFKRHDEDKVFLGFDDAAAAKASFLAHRSDERAFGGMSTIPLREFTRKLKRRGGTGKIRATALVTVDQQLEHHQAIVEGVLALAARHDQAVVALKASPRSLAGQRRAKTYADALGEKAKRLAARALAVDLAGMKEDIDAATSFDDLRARLLTRYRDMDPARMARIVEKARVMANLGGRLSVLEEV